MTIALKVFDMKDSHGMPFDLLGVMLKEKGMVPDWEDFCDGAICQNWSPEQIMRSAEELASPLGFWNDPEFQIRLKA